MRENGVCFFTHHASFFPRQHLSSQPRTRYNRNMELYLLRHGLAVERGTRGFADDSARPLAPKGRRQLRKTSGALKKLKLDFDLILSSPFLRAKQTAEIVAAGLKLKKRLKFSNALAPGGAPAILLRQLARHQPAPEKILLVGHEPDLSRLVSLLATGNLQLQLDFKKGGLCKLDAKKLSAGKCATLAWLLTPKQMKMF
jgi:phosphohistidine phosphatase